MPQQQPPMPPNNPFENLPDPEAEAAQIQEIADLTVELLDMRYGNVTILRAVHPKSHACVNGFFEIREDVPEDLRVGLFARPGTRYEAWVSYSNVSVVVAHDLKDGNNGSRGMAIKVMDIEGDVLFSDAGRTSQDFLMINQPAFAFANVKDYLRLTQIIRANNDDARPFFAPLQAPTDEFSSEDLARIDADGDGVIDRIEDELRSDKNDRTKMPEDFADPDTCLDGAANDGDGSTDAADPDCDPCVVSITDTFVVPGKHKSDSQQELTGFPLAISGLRICLVSFEGRRPRTTRDAQSAPEARASSCYTGGTVDYFTPLGLRPRYSRF